MTNYARVVDNVAVDVSTDPQNQFHPTLAEQFVEVPDNVKRGWVLKKGTWAAPPAPPSPPALVVKYSMLTPTQYYLAFTPAERMAIKASTDALVKELWATFEFAAAQPGTMIDPNLASVVSGLTYLATPASAKPPGPGILASTDRIAQIQAGIPQ